MTPSPTRVAQTYLRNAAATPLPISFPSQEMGLMTRDEYLEYLNPQEKYHSPDSFDTNLKSLNSHLGYLGVMDDKTEVYHAQGKPETELVFLQEDIPVGVLHKGILYHAPKWRLPRHFGYMRNHDWVPLGVPSPRPVKYVSEYVGLVETVAATNQAEYPHVLQHILLKGEPFQIRAEKQPQRDEGTTLVALNAKGELVAMASDEWGATLLRVAREYRGKGIGQVLGRFWRDLNPSYTSGGFTSAGEANALKLWEGRVREFIANGWYTELVREGKISRERVKDILKGLKGSVQRNPLTELETKPQETKQDVLVWIDPGISFIVYDARALEVPDTEMPDEKYIYAYGFFRSSEQVGTFLFRIDYERKFQKLATAIALQMARDENEPLYVGKGYTDIVEWENVPGIEKNGDYITLTRDLLPLRDMMRLERARRKPVDPYRQREALLIEAAETKWG